MIVNNAIGELVIIVEKNGRDLPVGGGTVSQGHGDQLAGLQVAEPEEDAQMACAKGGIYVAQDYRRPRLARGWAAFVPPR
jgi:hypothetical protein